LRALAEGTPQLVKIVAAEEVRQTRKRGELMVATTCPSGGSLDIFIEPRLPRPLLLVFGETPVAETLAKLGDLTGFRSRTVSQAGLASLSVPTADVWAVVATMGHYDEDAVEAALAHPGLDVSLIASTRRAAAVRGALLARGLDEHTVERLRTPAGKVRGATQEQIALLALAEVVVARQKRGPKQPTLEAPQVVFATDPVCGMTVDPLSATHKSEFGGNTFWFCSAGCQVEFEKEPQRYLRPIEA
jgi:xanthine dehydrogenase accessory factor